MRHTLFLIFQLIFLIGCKPSIETTSAEIDTKMTPQLFTVKLGIQPDEYIKLNGLDPKSNIDEQPAGLNFYEKDWPSDSRGKVYVDHEKHSFILKNMLTAVGVENVSFPERGIKSYNLNGGGASQSLDFHDAIRKRFLLFLQELKEKQWEPYIYFSDPRLPESEAVRYLLEEDDYYTIPLSYSLSHEEWMQLKNPKWRLYVDGVFLDITFNRDSKAMDPNGYGSYLFSYQLYDSNEKGANQMKSNDRQNWKNLWVDKIKELKKIRYAKEAELIKKGYTIDTDYVDPKIHPADPVEP